MKIIEHIVGVTFQDRWLRSLVLAICAVKPFFMSTCPLLSARINAMTIWKPESISVWTMSIFVRLLFRLLEPVVYNILLVLQQNTCSNMSKTIFCLLRNRLSESRLSSFQQTQKRCKVRWYNWGFQPVSPNANSLIQLSNWNSTKCVQNTHLNGFPWRANLKR